MEAIKNTELRFETSIIFLFYLAELLVALVAWSIGGGRLCIIQNQRQLLLMHTWTNWALAVGIGSFSASRELLLLTLCHLLMKKWKDFDKYLNTRVISRQAWRTNFNYPSYFFGDNQRCRTNQIWSKISWLVPNLR